MLSAGGTGGEAKEWPGGANVFRYAILTPVSSAPSSQAGSLVEPHRRGATLREEGAIRELPHM